MEDPELIAARAVLWHEPATGDEERWHAQLLEQYKLYVELADRISQRRGATNTFFATVSTALLTALAAFTEQEDTLLAGLLAPAVGIALCWLWEQLLQSYRTLNTAKFKVIGLLEERLPTSPWYEAEWKMLGEGETPSLYTPLAPIEKRVPKIFAAFYAVVALRWLTLEAWGLLGPLLGGD